MKLTKLWRQSKMSSNEQTNKFAKFLRNHAALLLLIFSVVAIATVILVVALSDDNTVIDQPVNSTPVDDKPATPVEEHNDPEPTAVKVYFTSPLSYTGVSMEYTNDTDNMFVFNPTLQTWSAHKGVDLTASDGTAVCAMYDGTVVEVTSTYGMGNIVKIDHGENVVATYASLGDVVVTNGQKVSKGEKIGTVSTSASYEFTDGAHLHLEISVNGVNVDPTKYVNGEVFREIYQDQ